MFNVYLLSGCRLLSLSEFQMPPATPDIPAPDRVAYLFGNTNVGPARVLTVKTGDHVDISAYARFDTGTGGNNGLIPNIVNAVTSAVNVVSIGETQVIYDAFDAWLPVFPGIYPIPNPMPLRHT